MPLDLFGRNMPCIN